MGLKFDKSSKIHHIVQIRQMLLKWKLGALFLLSSAPPPDVPKGHMAVHVGQSRRRYVVRATHMNHAVFQELLARAAEEYGYDNVGPLSIPCEESEFEQVMHHISSSSRSSSSSKFMDVKESPRSSCCCCCCHVPIRQALKGEALPLLRGFTEKSAR